ncbi:hypothetical protein [aff. Roholtiella sp. LEGE 12411]|nr:hypothetical protein [aff. Roholtiella sp. LEGE 12411]
MALSSTCFATLLHNDKINIRGDRDGAIAPLNMPVIPYLQW